MINIYTKVDSNISDKIQHFNDRLFNTKVFGSEFTDNEKKVIKQIDHAKVVDQIKIETDFGIGSVLDLSTGCKTAINILRFPNQIISVDECGSNVLKIILQYKEANIFKEVKTPVRRMTTELLREYLANYQNKNNCSKVTVDNVRRNLSSFFSWLEEEDYILKSPVRRIHKIRTKTAVKEVISDENMEMLWDNCTVKRDLAMIDLLSSTGMRVGELVNLDISDINFEERECVVYGKGDKERRVYFDARTKIHLKEYIESRCDDNQALFVTLNAPFDRLKISGVEIRLRELGRKLNIEKVHPHKFRRTMATRAIDKGMPIEQVQKLLGHQQIDTTMKYAMVSQSNVKSSHRKYIA